MSIIIKNASLLHGRDLEFVERGSIQISEDGIITRVSTSLEYDRTEADSILDAEGFLLLPGLINAHTHIGDSIAKDITSDPDLSASVDPSVGIKRKILTRTDPSHLEAFMRNAAISMLNRGIVTFADFREGWLDGVNQLHRALSGLKIKSVILGRIEQYFRPSYSHFTMNSGSSNFFGSTEITPDIMDVLGVSDGLGISGANENTDHSLLEFAKATMTYESSSGMHRLLAIHAAESRETTILSITKTGMTEVERAVNFLKPDFLVHMTHATDKDISLASENRIGIVVCPRSNGLMACGIPRISDMLINGCVVGIGTDNVMLNSPDMFKEMDYLWKVSRGTGARSVSAKDILKMATVNGAEILHLNSGCIEPGRLADILFIDKKHIDLFPIHDPHASIVQRVDQGSIMGVMINGEFVNPIL